MKVKRIVKREPDAAVWDKVGWMRSIGCSEEEINEALKPAKTTVEDIKTFILMTIDNKYSNKTLTEELEQDILDEKLKAMQIMSLQPGDVVQIRNSNFTGNNKDYHSLVVISNYCNTGTGKHKEIVHGFIITSQPPVEDSIKRFKYKLKHPEVLNLTKDSYVSYSEIRNNSGGFTINGKRLNSAEKELYNKLKQEIAEEEEKNQNEINELRKIIADSEIPEVRSKARDKIHELKNKPKRFAEDEFTDNPGRLEKEDLLGLVASIERDWEDLNKYSRNFNRQMKYYKYFIDTIKTQFSEAKEN